MLSGPGELAVDLGAVLECGGLTPLSFCVSFAFCTKAVGKVERKKGTAKAYLGSELHIWGQYLGSELH